MSVFVWRFRHPCHPDCISYRIVSEGTDNSMSVRLRVEKYRIIFDDDSNVMLIYEAKFMREEYRHTNPNALYDVCFFW